MLPSLKSGDKVVTFNWFYFPKVGDVVVAKWRQKLIIKRIVELKNDSIILKGDYTDSTSSEKLGQFRKDQIIGQVIVVF